MAVVGKAPINTKGEVKYDVSFEIVFLGERAAVLRNLPDPEEDDDSEQPLYVFRKTGAEALQELVRLEQSQVYQTAPAC